MINISEVDTMYTEYSKSKGVKVKYTNTGRIIVVHRKPRKICAPCEELKKEQRRILDEELSSIKIHKCAYGFMPNRTIYDNAREHIGAVSILNIDMKDFFTTITEKQVFNALVLNHIEKDKAEYISKVCTYKGTLPQGAPTSPMLSNIIAKAMDKKLQALCKEDNITYTRYADDITLSANLIEKLLTIKPKVFSLINSFNWKISGSKVHIISNNNRGKSQEVTGVVIVGKQLKVGMDNLVASKSKVQALRSILHNIERDIGKGIIISLTDLTEKYKSIESLTGYANYLKQTNKKYEKYLEKVLEIRKILVDKV